MRSRGLVRCLPRRYHERDLGRETLPHLSLAGRYSYFSAGKSAPVPVYRAPRSVPTPRAPSTPRRRPVTALGRKSLRTGNPADPVRILFPVRIKAKPSAKIPLHAASFARSRLRAGDGRVRVLHTLLAISNISGERKTCHRACEKILTVAAVGGVGSTKTVCKMVLDHL